ncbi:unnamed protein product [marine sediment metagenome]|uniref:Uncharacterized protein n=1 Tax=marine sediment metagenome TaxID=412755 RepID=X1SWU8_9ZZZZ
MVSELQDSALKNDAKWAFDIIAEVGYNYDSSIFPTARGHDGL